MNDPTLPRRPSQRGDSAVRQVAARRRWRRPAWLVAFALAVHLLVPGLCLAQMLSAAPLGQICSAAAAQDRAATSPLPDERADRHALESCDQCAASVTAIAPGPAPAIAAKPPPDGAPRTAQAPPVGASRTAWRPPPRGPPRTA